MEQLRALRQEAHARFLAQKAGAPEKDAAAARPGPAPAPAAPPATGAKGPGGGPGGGPSFLAALPPEMLDAPISSLLADAPPPTPAAKRPRLEEHSMRVPPERTAEIRSLLQQPPPAELRILAWNIDGLDEVGDDRDRMLRTLAVARDVAVHRPVAVLLQEVVPPALELLSAPQVLGGHYEVVVPEDPPLPYYVAILLDRRRTRRVGKVATENFPGSKMGRQLLSVAVEVTGSGGPPILLATAHLESTKDMGDERRRQLAIGLRRLREAVGRPAAGSGAGGPSAAPVGMALLAGDLNLRDNEVKDVSRSLGTDGPAVADAWVFCGSPGGARWTWDTAENNNLGVTYTCRTRFDRVFFVAPGVAESCSIGGPPQGARGKASKSAGKVTGSGWRPTGISLLGKERVPGLGRFPSDHWGVLTTWTAGGASEVAPAPSAAPAQKSGIAKFAASPASQGCQAGGHETPGLLPNVVAGKFFINLND